MEEEKRSDICRLCELPVEEGAVQLSRGELDKVSAWLEHKTGHGLCFSDDVDDGEGVEMENCWICQHCFWDARFEHENSAESNLMDTLIWWPIHLDDKSYENYCKAELQRASNENQETSSAEEPEKDIGSDESELQDLQVVKSSSLIKQDNVEASSKSYTDAKGRLISCPYCTTSITPTSRMVRQHIKRRHARIAIKCNYNMCGIYFKTEDERPEHERKYHEVGSGTKKYWCIYCERWFHQHTQSRHIKLHHHDVAIKCTRKFCSTFFKSEDEREKHVRDVHQIVKAKRIFHCVYCERFINDLSQYSSHVRSMHNDIAIKCKNKRCGKYFKSQEDLQNHFEQTHATLEKLKIHKCNFCDYKAVKKCEVERHLKENHLRSEIIKCHTCGTIFKTKDSLKRHCLNVHGGEKETCAHCGTKLKYLKRHAQIQYCKICSEQFPCDGLMDKHRAQCSEKGPHECKICSINFKIPSNLKYHMTSMHKAEIITGAVWKGLKYKHLGFKCKECFKYYANKGSLTEHKQMAHSTNNKYQTTCELCKKTFSCRGVIAIHMRTHGFGRENITCFKCAKLFRSRNELNNHWKNIHGQNELIQCEICSKIILSRGLKDHKLRVHSLLQ